MYECRPACAAKARHHAVINTPLSHVSARGQKGIALRAIRYRSSDDLDAARLCAAAMPSRRRNELEVIGSSNLGREAGR